MPVNCDDTIDTVLVSTQTAGAPTTEHVAQRHRRRIGDPDVGAGQRRVVADDVLEVHAAVTAGDGDAERRPLQLREPDHAESAARRQIGDVDRRHARPRHQFDRHVAADADDRQSLAGREAREPLPLRPCEDQDRVAIARRRHRRRHVQEVHARAAGGVHDEGLLGRHERRSHGEDRQGGDRKATAGGTAHVRHSLAVARGCGCRACFGNPTVHRTAARATAFRRGPRPGVRPRPPARTGQHLCGAGRATRARWGEGMAPRALPRTPDDVRGMVRPAAVARRRRAVARLRPLAVSPYPAILTR